MKLIVVLLERRKNWRHMTSSQELCCSHYRTYAATTETVPKTSQIFIFSEKRQGFEHALLAPQVPLSFAVQCGIEHDHVTVVEVNSKRFKSRSSSV